MAVGRRLLYLWPLWGVCLAVWTAALLTTYPVQVSKEVLPPQWGFPAAKTLHVSAYAFLTALAAWLPARRCWPLLVLLSLHGCATEFFQQWVPGRHGSFMDVGWDHLGIALGLALTWKWWRRGVARLGGGPERTE